MKTTMTVAQAKEGLEQWWFTSWQVHVDIIGFARQCDTLPHEGRAECGTNGQHSPDC